MLTNQHKKFLNTHFSKIAYNQSLKHYTRFHIGGLADAIVFPQQLNQLAMLLPWLNTEQIPWIVLGGGSNILFDDQGFRGIVINLTQFCLMNPESVLIRADAGIPLKRLCLHAIRYHLDGMNFALGIPGTLGGAIHMNAGAAGSEMADILESIDCMTPDGQIYRIQKYDLKIQYRSISWHHIAPHGIVVQANIRLQNGDSKTIRKNARECLMIRKQTQPIGCACAGSFFKNPSNAKPAGYLIDQAGLKGYQIGDAAISDQHANFIVNKGRATSKDIIALMHLIQEKVFVKFNVHLEPEVKIIHV